MKFIVNEMPEYASQCPFYENGICKVDGYSCIYFGEDGRSGCASECDHLRPIR